VKSVLSSIVSIVETAAYCEGSGLASVGGQGRGHNYTTESPEHGGVGMADGGGGISLTF
jgi:hypothetical protein